MQWQVELLDSGARHGPRVPMVTEVVTADELTTDAGALVFTTGGIVSRAVAANSWAGVLLLVEADA